MSAHPINKRIPHPDPWGPRLPITREKARRIRARIQSKRRQR